MQTPHIIILFQFILFRQNVLINAATNKDAAENAFNAFKRMFPTILIRQFSYPFGKDWAIPNRTFMAPNTTALEILKRVNMEILHKSGIKEAKCFPGEKFLANRNFLAKIVEESKMLTEKERSKLIKEINKIGGPTLEAANVQWLKLFLSFAIRLAIMIGSDSLGKAADTLHQFYSMSTLDEFLNAFECLQKIDPTMEHSIFPFIIEADIPKRFFKIHWDSVELQESRIFNFQTILYIYGGQRFSIENWVRQINAMCKLKFNSLAGLYSPFSRLIWGWNGQIEESKKRESSDEIEQKVEAGGNFILDEFNMLALKRFILDLIGKMLSMWKFRKYFAANKDVLAKFKKIKKELSGEIAEHWEKINSSDWRKKMWNDFEVELHFVDALPIGTSEMEYGKIIEEAKLEFEAMKEKLMENCFAEFVDNVPDMGDLDGLEKWGNAFELFQAKLEKHLKGIKANEEIMDLILLEDSELGLKKWRDPLMRGWGAIEKIREKLAILRMKLEEKIESERAAMKNGGGKKFGLNFEFLKGKTKKFGAEEVAKKKEIWEREKMYTESIKLREELVRKCAEILEELEAINQRFAKKTAKKENGGGKS